MRVSDKRELPKLDTQDFKVNRVSQSPALDDVASLSYDLQNSVSALSGNSNTS